MKQTNKIKLFLYGVIATLTLSLAHLPTTSAVEGCFAAENAFNDWSDPYRSGGIMIPVIATCDMKLYSMDISFNDAENVDGLKPSHSSAWHTEIHTYTEKGVRVIWSGDDDDDDDDSQDVSKPYIDVEADESLFGYWYDIPTETTTFKHNMPVTINSAKYEINGEIKTVENLVLDAIATVTPNLDKDVLMISGVENQDVSYTGQPVALEEDLAVEDNDDDISVDDLNTQFYKVDKESGAKTPIDRPTDPGTYMVEYSFENDNYRASLKVSFAIKEYVVVEVEVLSGHGQISAPHYVDKGSDFRVDITPESGYEVLWVEYNGKDVTDLLNEDNSLDIKAVNENAEIAVAFRPFYRVISGDGGKYTKGSGDELNFVVDKDPESYDEGIVVIAVDDQYVDLDNDSIVDPEAQTITLLGNYLETLEVGEHNIEIYFFDTSMHGVARATFTVVETADDDDDDEEEIVVPDTGRSTSETNASEVMALPTMIAACLVLGLIAIRKKDKKR